MEEDKSKGIIVDECSTEEDESECVHKNIIRQKDAKNEAEYKCLTRLRYVPYCTFVLWTTAN